MANYGMFLGWNRPITGRENDAAEMFSAAINYWTTQQKNGMIESFEPVILDQHGGDLNGFFLVRGDRDKIHQVTKTDDYKQLMMNVNHVVNGFGAITALVGDSVVDYMTRWKTLISK